MWPLEDLRPREEAVDDGLLCPVDVAPIDDVAVDEDAVLCNLNNILFNKELDRIAGHAYIYPLHIYTR